MPRYAIQRSLTLNEQKRIKEFELMLWSIRFHDELPFLIEKLLPGVDVQAFVGSINKLFALGSINRQEAYIYMTKTRTPQKIICDILNKGEQWLDKFDKELVRNIYLMPISPESTIKQFETLLRNFYERYDMLKGYYSFNIDWPEENPNILSEETRAQGDELFE